jgi:hypothetical protein
MPEVKLGQLFLLRRDVKQEISNLGSEINTLLHYREDQASTASEYSDTLQNLQDARNKLHLYDLLIEGQNSQKDTVTFNENKYSLNDARHYKVHLVAELSHLEMMVRHTSSYSKRVDRENEYVRANPTDPNSQVIPQMVERKYIINPDVKNLKAQVKALKQDVQLLDSLIQQADWELTVSIL